MSAFTDPTSVANRALQHVGATRIVDGALLTENSKNADEIRACYDKLRRAELRRNIWRFATRKCALRPVDTTTKNVAFSAWDASVNYVIGSVVASGGVNYQSVINDNLNQTPGTSAAAWRAYFGPLCAQPYDSAVTYYAGELVYVPDGVGNYNLYVSFLNGNANSPSAAPAWSATTTYSTDQVVLYSSARYQSLVGLNTGNTPNTSPDEWGVFTVPAFNAGTTYASGATVYYNGFGVYGGAYYLSQQSSNTGNTPTPADHTWWVLDPTLGNLANGWLLVSAVLSDLTPVYPLGTGPLGQAGTKNVFLLPSGYLREAPQSTKAGSYTVFGAPSNLAYTDWEYEGNYITSSSTGPILYRFVADVQAVPEMDDMFCEALGCRIAFETCETLTQSSAKLQAIGAEYKKFQSEAIAVNGIEIGPVEPPLDDFLFVRY